MKRLLYLFALLNVLVLRAQTDSLTVHVDGQPLAYLLTDEQKQNVNYLFITGTLAEEDYAFLRGNSGNNLPKLHELNLRKADIDTIPKKAFYRWEWEHNWGNIHEFSVVLPEQLELIGDSAFNDECGLFDYDIILTGKFPKIGFDILPLYHEKHFKVSKDNPFCTTEEAIFSMDKKHLYFNHHLTTIPETVEVIEEKAFQNNLLTNVVFPKSLKEIKDYAFYNCDAPDPTGGSSYGWEFIFQTEYPPILGMEVFGGGTNFFIYDAILVVPEGCYENYINADEQWNIFKTDRRELSLKELNTRTTLQVKKESTGWLISCKKSIHQIQLYNASGMLINEIALNGVKEYVIPHQDKMTFCIMRVLLDNGEEFTVKL